MKKALNLTMLKGRGISQLQAIPMIAEAGFSGCFYVAEEGVSPSQIAAAVREAGMTLDFIHAPVTGVDALWKDAPEQRLQTLISWVHICAENQVPVMVSHVWTKYTPLEPGTLGIHRFKILLDEAQKCGIKIAFENAEVGKFLTCIRENLWDHPAAFYCYDSGHELCYSDGADQLAEFGDRLLCTHLNDNMGRTGPEYTSADDCHMMPFDGKADWNGIASRLQKRDFRGPLTFELKMQNKPGRHTHDIYEPLTPTELLALAYRKAVQFEMLLERQKI